MSAKAQPKRHQVGRACHHCAVSHLSCSELRPCPRCIQKGIECFERVRKRRRASQDVAPGTGLDDESPSSSKPRKSTRATRSMSSPYLGYPDVLLAETVDQYGLASETNSLSSASVPSHNTGPPGATATNIISMTVPAYANTTLNTMHPGIYPPGLVPGYPPHSMTMSRFYSGYPDPYLSAAAHVPHLVGHPLLPPSATTSHPPVAPQLPLSKDDIHQSLMSPIFSGQPHPYVNSQMLSPVNSGTTKFSQNPHPHTAMHSVYDNQVFLHNQSRMVPFSGNPTFVSPSYMTKMNEDSTASPLDTSGPEKSSLSTSQATTATMANAPPNYSTDSGPVIGDSSGRGRPSSQISSNPNCTTTPASAFSGYVPGVPEGGQTIEGTSEARSADVIPNSKIPLADASSLVSPTNSEHSSGTGGPAHIQMAHSPGLSLGQDRIISATQMQQIAQHQQQLFIHQQNLLYQQYQQQMYQRLLQRPDKSNSPQSAILETSSATDSNMLSLPWALNGTPYPALALPQTTTVSELRNSLSSHLASNELGGPGSQLFMALWRSGTKFTLDDMNADVELRSLDVGDPNTVLEVISKPVQSMFTSGIQTTQLDQQFVSPGQALSAISHSQTRSPDGDATPQLSVAIETGDLQRQTIDAVTLAVSGESIQ